MHFRNGVHQHRRHAQQNERDEHDVEAAPETGVGFEDDDADAVSAELHMAQSTPMTLDCAWLGGDYCTFTSIARGFTCSRCVCG